MALVTASAVVTDAVRGRPAAVVHLGIVVEAIVVLAGMARVAGQSSAVEDPASPVEQAQERLVEIAGEVRARIVDEVAPEAVLIRIGNVANRQLPCRKSRCP